MGPEADAPQFGGNAQAPQRWSYSLLDPGRARENPQFQEKINKCDETLQQKRGKNKTKQKKHPSSIKGNILSPSYLNLFRDDWAFQFLWLYIDTVLL